MVSSDRAVFAILVVLALLYLQQQDTPEGAGRRRRRREAAPPPAPSAGGWGTILSRVKWETISKMLHWKSEVSSLDGILQGLDELATPPPPPPPS
jgi:hypothetical protein